MNRLSPLVLIILLAAPPAVVAAPAPSVLVSTIPVKSGAIARDVTAYGTVGPGPGASDTLTINYAGIVQEIDVVPGSRVAKGAPLALIGTAPSAQAAYAQAEAALLAADQTLAHTRSLLAAHLATRTQLAQAKQAATAARSARDALRRDGAAGKTATISAPYDGVASMIPAARGATLRPGSPIMTILRTDRLVATVGLDRRDAAIVRPGESVSVTPLAGGSQGAMSGRVMAIAGIVNPQSGLLDATVALSGADAVVGEAVVARITTDIAHGVIVPRDTALPSGKGFSIWQVRSGHAVEVPVRIAARRGGDAVVAGRIDPTLPIVTAGNYQLKPGIAVRTQR